jgi:hypothetical protein
MSRLFFVAQVLKRAGHSIGTVYIWDVDLVAVGVAVKRHPEIEFKVRQGETRETKRGPERDEGMKGAAL